MLIKNNNTFVCKVSTEEEMETFMNLPEKPTEEEIAHYKKVAALIRKEKREAKKKKEEEEERLLKEKQDKRQALREGLPPSDWKETKHCYSCAHCEWDYDEQYICKKHGFLMSDRQSYTHVCKKYL